MAAASNGRIYAIGGYGASGRVATVEEYDPAINTWRTRARMPTARNSRGVAVASNGKLYAIGGELGRFTGNPRYLNTVEEGTLP